MPKKIRIRPRFYIIAIAAAALIAGLLVIILHGPAEAYAQTGTIVWKKEADAVVMRDERIVRTENYGKTVFAVQEGEKVERGIKVADVYKWGYNENSVKDLMDIQQKIKDYQENNILRDILDKDLESINSKIAEKQDEIDAVINGRSTNDLLLIQQQTQGLMAQRMDYLKQTVQADEALNALYAQQDELTKRINSWKIEILADAPGTVSFYLDGYEDLLRLDNMDQITYNDLINITSGIGKTKATESASQKPLYRLVNDGKWYCLLLSPKGGMDELRQDTTVNINFEGFSEQTYQAKVSLLRDMQGGARVTVLQIDGSIGPMLDVRRVKAHLKVDFTGIKLPAAAVKKQDGKEGVYLLEGSSKRFVFIDVLAREGNDCIIRPKYAGDEISINQRIQLQ